MRILLLGSGGREHALAWKIAASPLCDELICAPGNPGMADLARCVAVDILDNAAVVALARAEKIDFVVVGPDNPLANGVVDALAAAGIKAFGPTKAAAQLESSKGFTKDLCAAAGIPTARYRRFHDAAAAKAYAATHPVPVVVKADGLALGKGVVIAPTERDAVAAVDLMFGGAFGDSGHSVVIEEFMCGEEASFFALCDGETALPFGTAQDHKRVGDGDEGPNTGGMGAYSPADVMPPMMVDLVMKRIIQPTLAAMKAKGMPFKGVLYAGLMLTDEGPKLVEYNARFGDPETQVLMPRLKSDLVPLLLACADGQLAHVDAQWTDDAALTVVMAANGYPGVPHKGTVIDGIAAVEATGALVFHAGTARRADGALTAAGGRVLNVTATGKTIQAAQAAAYAAIKNLHWPEGFCRTDIGWRAVARETKHR
ncbi:MAG: phosphoribosylamine--glycine ligase [Alphaproteobacteria bacterium]|nr:phosphoribosylamine--glycine ligase [Alphaproteobacteria bacterium]